MRLKGLWKRPHVCVCTSSYTCVFVYVYAYVERRRPRRYLVSSSQNTRNQRKTEFSGIGHVTKSQEQGAQKPSRGTTAGGSRPPAARISRILGKYQKANFQHFQDHRECWALQFPILWEWQKTHKKNPRFTGLYRMLGTSVLLSWILGHIYPKSIETCVFHVSSLTSIAEGRVYIIYVWVPALTFTDTVMKQ